MRLEPLRYLSDVPQYHSLSAISQKYFVSVQTISAAIKSLEELLNLTLLERDYNGVRLTSAGKEIVEAVQPLLDYADQLHGRSEK